MAELEINIGGKKYSVNWNSAEPPTESQVSEIARQIARPEGTGAENPRHERMVKGIHGSLPAESVPPRLGGNRPVNPFGGVTAGGHVASVNTNAGNNGVMGVMGVTDTLNPLSKIQQIGANQTPQIKKIIQETKKAVAKEKAQREAAFRNVVPGYIGPPKQTPKAKESVTQDTDPLVETLSYLGLSEQNIRNAIDRGQSTIMTSGGEKPLDDVQSFLQKRGVWKSIYPEHKTQQAVRDDAIANPQTRLDEDTDAATAYGKLPRPGSPEDTGLGPRNRTSNPFTVASDYINRIPSRILEHVGVDMKDKGNAALAGLLDMGWGVGKYFAAGPYGMAALGTVDTGAMAEQVGANIDAERRKRLWDNSSEGEDVKRGLLETGKQFVVDPVAPLFSSESGWKEKIAAAGFGAVTIVGAALGLKAGMPKAAVARDVMAKFAQDVKGRTGITRAQAVEIVNKAQALLEARPDMVVPETIAQVQTRVKGVVGKEKPNGKPETTASVLTNEDLPVYENVKAIKRRLDRFADGRKVPDEVGATRNRDNSGRPAERAGRTTGQPELVSPTVKESLQVDHIGDATEKIDHIGEVNEMVEDAPDGPLSMPANGNGKEINKQPWEMTREEFFGSPRIYDGKINAKETPKKVYAQTEIVQREPFMDYEIKKGESQYVVYDGDKVVATYSNGDNLTVDPKYRRKGIATELLKAYKLERDPKPTAASRSKQAQKVYIKAHDEMVHDAVSEGKSVPDNVLAEYKGKDWADAEIAKRDRLTIQESQTVESPGRTGTESRVPVASLNGKTEMGPSDLILDTEELLGKKIRQGKTAPRSVGTYYPGSGLTKIKFNGAIGTTAHELSHWLDDVYGLGKDWHSPRTKSPYDKELFQAEFMNSIRPSYNLRTKRAEAIAEWLRAWIVNPAEAERLAPSWYKHFKGRIPADTVSAIRTWGDKIRTWHGLDPLAKTKANVDFAVRADNPSVVEKVVKLFQDGTKENIQFRQQFTDDLAPIDVASRKLAGILGIDDLRPSKDAYLLARNHRYLTMRFDDMLANGVMTGDGKRIGGPMSQFLEHLDISSVESLNKDYQDMVALAISERTIEKSGQLGRTTDISGVGGGLDNDVAIARKTIAQLKTDAERYARLSRAADSYRNWTRSFLDYAVEEGLLTSMQVRNITSMNEAFIAMKRVIGDAAQAPISRGSRRLSNPKNPIRQFGGSGRKIANPLTESIADAYEIVQNVERNQIIGALGDLLNTSAGRGLHEGLVPEIDSIGYHVPASEKGRKLTYIRNGKKKYLKLDDDLTRAIDDMSELWNPHWVIRAAALPARVLRGSATSAPSFLIRNVIRDTVNRAIVTEHDVLPKQKLATNSDMAHYGAGASREHYLDDARTYYDVQKKAMRNLAKDKKNVLAVIRKTGDVYLDVKQWSEMFNRELEFNAAYEHAKKNLGYGERDAKLYAGQAARDLQDFMKGGRVTRMINRFVPFTNAKLQGMIRMGRSLKEQPKATMTKMIIATAIPVAMERVWNQYYGANEERDQLSEYQKLMFYNLKIGDGWLRIPKGHENAVFGDFLERSLSKASGDDHAFSGSLDMLGAQMLLFDDSSLIPQAMQAGFNKDLFRDRDIVPDWEEGMNLDLRDGTKHASTLGQMLQKATRIDARKLDYLISAYGADWGRTSIMVSDIGSDKPQSLYRWLNQAFGMTTDVSGYGTRDYQWLSDHFKGIGQKNPLAELAKQVLSEKDADRKNELNLKLIRAASAMRSKLESK